MNPQATHGRVRPSTPDAGEASALDHEAASGQPRPRRHVLGVGDPLPPGPSGAGEKLQTPARTASDRSATPATLAAERLG